MLYISYLYSYFNWLLKVKTVKIVKSLKLSLTLKVDTKYYYYHLNKKKTTAAWKRWGNTWCSETYLSYKVVNICRPGRENDVTYNSLFALNGKICYLQDNTSDKKNTGMPRIYMSSRPIIQTLHSYLQFAEVEAVWVEEKVWEVVELWDKLLDVVDVVHQASPGLPDNKGKSDHYNRM